jgi:hypothetical protein
MESWCNDNLQVKTEVLMENPIIMPLYSPQILYGLACNLTETSMARSRGLTARAAKAIAWIPLALRGMT